MNREKDIEDKKKNDLAASLRAGARITSHFSAGLQARWRGASDELYLGSYVRSEQQSQRACGPQPERARRRALAPKCEFILAPALRYFLGVFGILAVQVLLLSPAAASAQTVLVSSNYFPAELEFKELHAIKSDQTLTETAAVSGVADGSLFSDVGLDKYSRRVYSLSDNGTLSIEIVRLKDARAAYSLLTLLRKADITAGPPGEWYAAVAAGVIFSRGDYWVRVEQQAGPVDLPKRVALSVSNRIGERASGMPSLVTHFPKTGFDASSVRYYLGPKSYDTYAATVAAQHLKFESDMEVAQAKYALQNMTGLLSLVSFPTIQLAEQFFDNVAGQDRTAGDKSRIYLKRIGPLIGILDGTFDSGTADEILGSLRFKYAIKWIYDKNSRSNQKIVWGVPMPILGTVVRSLLLTALLCGLSLFAGIGFAVFRLALRGYAPRNYLDRPERTEIIRLKINEN